MERVDAGVIRLKGVRQNNLKNLSLDLPKGHLVVITGPSGSGKSSLAFDTLFAEGQRRYIETFSPYARQFFDRMDKPKADLIEGIPPAIAIEQRNTVRTTRSTVGTMTEICDYAKVIWPYLATLYCRQCQRAVVPEPPSGIWETITGQSSPIPESAEVLITFDLPLSEKLSWSDTMALIQKQGYRRALVPVNSSTSPSDANQNKFQIINLDQIDSKQAALSKKLSLIQDRVRVTGSNRSRFVESCEQAYHFGQGKLTLCEITPSHSLKPCRGIG